MYQEEWNRPSPPKTAYPISGAGVVNSTPEITDRVLAIDAIAGALGTANADLNHHLMALREILDNLLGGIPEKSQGEASAPVMGRLGHLARQAQDTTTLANLIGEQVRRLRTL